MRLSLRQLQIFIAIVESGSTTAAAERIALSQSATSAALKELESLLTTRLFDRVGKRLLLNDAGRALLPQARWVLDGAQGIESQFGASTETIASRLRVGASTTIGNYLMPGLIASFRDTHPDTQIAVNIGNTQDIAAAVANFEVDLGLIEGPSHQPELKATAWMRDELVIVCAPGYELAQHLPQEKLKSAHKVPLEVSLKSLGEAQWLLREPGSGTREAVEQALRPHLHQLQADLQLGGTEAIKQAAAEGLGVTCLSRCVIEDFVTLGRLVVLNTALPPLTRRFYLIQHEKKYPSAGLERFIAHCLVSAPV